jgi:hypothetical protein
VANNCPPFHAYCKIHVKEKNLLITGQTAHLSSTNYNTHDSPVDNHWDVRLHDAAMPQMQPAVHQVQQHDAATSSSIACHDVVHQVQQHDDAAMPQMQPAVHQVQQHDAATSSFPICTNLPHQDKDPVATKSAYDSVSSAFISLNTTAKDNRD